MKYPIMQASIQVTLATGLGNNDVLKINYEGNKIFSFPSGIYEHKIVMQQNKYQLI